MTSAAVIRVTPVTTKRAGEAMVCYGLVVVIAWCAIMKFAIEEAEGIKPMVAGSPLLGWSYHFLSVGSFSVGLGVVELTIACLIALRSVSAKACLIGSAGAVGMFLTTPSFLF